MRVQKAMDRYGVALLLLSLAVLPLGFISIWLSVAAGVILYALLARLAGRDLDCQSQRRRTIRPRVIFTKR